MKILLIGNRHLKGAFEYLGHAVMFLNGKAAETLDVSSIHADLLIVHESLGMRTIPHGLERAPFPTVFYSIDVHLNLYWHREFARLFDYVFVSQKDYVAQFKHNQAYWLPWSVNPHVMKDLHLSRVFDITFVGSIDCQRMKRRGLIEALQKKFSVRTYGTVPDTRLTMEQMARIYSQSKIILNESICGEVTFRTFEATACGGMLLTERINNGLHALFRDGEEIVTFDYGDFIDKAGYYLHNAAERQRVARQGRDRVMRHHTNRTRAATMLAVLERNNFSTFPRHTESAPLYYGKVLYYTALKFPRYRRRRLVRAKTMLTAALGLPALHCQASLFLGLVLVYQNNFSAALEILRPYRSLHEAAPLAAVLYALVRHKLGDAGHLTALLSGPAGLPPDVHNDIFYRLGKFLEHRGLVCDIGGMPQDDFPMNALDCYSRSCSAEGMFARGQVFYRRALFDWAAASFRTALDAGCACPELHQMLAASVVRSYNALPPRDNSADSRDRCLPETLRSA